MTLIPYVQILGKGPVKSRSLTRKEAHSAMEVILSGNAEAAAVGAVLMLLRARGETAHEVAGLTDALRASLPNWNGPTVDLDWPSYAAGRTRGLPWFLLAARLIADAGVSVLIHGWNSHQNPVASVTGSLADAEIEIAGSVKGAAEIIARSGVTYLPLETLSPEALALLRLRDVLGLRSIVNTVLRVLNPARSYASVQGVFHPSYRELQSDASELMGLNNMTVIKGGGGEFERHPGKEMQLFGLRGQSKWSDSAPPLRDDTRRLAECSNSQGDLGRLWSGELNDEFALDIVLGTAALALETVGKAATSHGLVMAQELWQERKK